MITSSCSLTSQIEKVYVLKVRPLQRVSGYERPYVGGRDRRTIVSAKHGKPNGSNKVTEGYSIWMRIEVASGQSQWDTMASFVTATPTP